jgi:hypothetical protein
MLSNPDEQNQQTVKQRPAIVCDRDNQDAQQAPGSGYRTTAISNIQPQKNACRIWPRSKIFTDEGHDDQLPRTEKSGGSPRHEVRTGKGSHANNANRVRSLVDGRLR